MTQLIDTPVLIAGGGPTGLVLACVLAHEGIKSVLAERNTHTTQFPKMDITNGVSMELLRRLGIDEELRQVGVAPQHSFDVIFAPASTGRRSPAGRCRPSTSSAQFCAASPTGRVPASRGSAVLRRCSRR
jgi:2-polyprenyl-6-methoxyphenol hydroxylase-like FAD-dependent oxidoreductase